MKEFELGQKMRDYIKQSDYGQARVARKLDVHPSTLNKWMQGVNQISPEKLSEFCALLNLTKSQRVELFKLAGYAALDIANQIHPAYSFKAPLPTYNDNLADFTKDLRIVVFSFKGQAAEYFHLNRSTVVSYEDAHLEPPLGYLACLVQLIFEERGGLETDRQNLLKEINLAVQYHYYQNKPFQTWLELLDLANDYLAERNQEAANVEATYHPHSKLLLNNTAAIRGLLKATFDDQELTIFCYDHFRDVYDKFTSQMTRPGKIQLLIVYCEKHDQLNELVTQLKHINPKQYDKFITSIKGSTKHHK